MAEYKEISPDYVVEWFQGVIDDLVDNLYSMQDSANHNRYASGLTAQEIGQFNTAGVDISPTKIFIELGMPEHYDFIDQGVKGVLGTKPRTAKSKYQFKTIHPSAKMVEYILPWMRFKGIVPRDGAGEKINSNISRKGLAYAIATQIKKQGIESVPFYSTVVNDQRIQILSDRFTELYGEDILNGIEFRFK